jgi:hypothetical protein
MRQLWMLGRSMDEPRARGLTNLPGAWGMGSSVTG